MLGLGARGLPCWRGLASAKSAPKLSFELGQVLASPSRRRARNEDARGARPTRGRLNAEVFRSIAFACPPKKKTRLGCPFLAQYLLDFVGEDATVFVFRLFTNRQAWRRVQTRELVVDMIRSVIIVAPRNRDAFLFLNAFYAHGMAPGTGRALSDMLDDVIEIAQGEQWRVMVRVVGTTLLIIPMR